MNTLTTRPLREEHRGLAAGAETLREAAEAVEHTGWKTMTLLDESVDFLLYRLIPYLRAASAVLYPRIEEALNAPGATAAVNRDLEEILSLTREVVTLRDGLTAAPTRQERRSLQRALYGLHAIVRLHLAKEAEIYLPRLASALAEEESARLLAELTEEANRLAEH